MQMGNQTENLQPMNCRKNRPDVLLWLIFDSAIRRVFQNQPGL
jgi:hypothetical protein